MSLNPTTGYRDEWLFRRPAIRTNLKNDTFLIPPFSANCGRVQGCLMISGYGNITPLVTAVAGTPAHSSFSIALDMKIGNQVFSDLNADVGIFNKYVNSGLTGELDVQLGYKNNIIIYIQGTSGGGLVKIDTGVIIPPYQWVNLVVNRGFAAGSSTIEIWLNGVMVYNNTLIATGFDSDNSFNLSFQDRTLQQISGKFGNFKLWFPALTHNYIINSYNRISSATNEITPANAWLNYPMNLASMLDLAGHGTPLTINGITQNNTTLDYPPVNYGGSFIATVFPLVLPTIASLIFPISTPPNPDHALAISWTDLGGVFQRRWLYHAANNAEDISGYSNYIGEPIVSPASIEVWNIDGRQKVNLTSPITVQLSTNSQPTLGTDRTPAIVTTIFSNSKLAVQFPSTDPLTPTIQQAFVPVP